MNLSVGWFLLAGGIIGAFRIATAKKFWKADFMNQEGIISERDRKDEVSVTPQKRWLLVAGCILLALIGGIQIQRAHDWNPFHGNAFAPSSEKR